MASGIHFSNKGKSIGNLMEHKNGTAASKVSTGESGFRGGGGTGSAHGIKNASEGKQIDPQFLSGVKIINEEQTTSGYASNSDKKGSNNHMPSLPNFNPEEYSGPETKIIENYLSITYSDKDSKDAKMVRNLLGIGIPDSKTLAKYTVRHSNNKIED
jgi:hypothetical protein